MLLLLASLSLSRPRAAADHAPDDRIRDFECFNIVRIIEHGAKSASAEDTRQRLNMHCDKLPDVRSEICHALIPSQIENISDQLNRGEHAEEICDSLGYSRVFGASRVILKDKCVGFVDLARAAAASAEGEETEDPVDNLPKPFKMLPGGGRDALRAYANGVKVCNDVSASDHMSCQIVTRLVAKVLRNEGKEGTSSEEICEGLAARRLIKFGDEKVLKQRRKEAPGEEDVEKYPPRKAALKKVQDRDD
jgi:hypothetical protein